MADGPVIRVLGPIEIVTPAGDLIDGGSRLRALLAALVISAGRAVPISSLMYVLWGDHPTAAAGNTLQTYVSQLRHVLGTGSVAHVDHSYRLDVDAGTIDAVRFERLLTAAIEHRSDPERCRALCRDALDLWRGRAFGDLTDDEPFALEANRLDELRLATMEIELEAELALGRHELIVGELEIAVVDHPYREGLWYLLIEALARSGRRVEALRTCERLRHELAEAGVDAGSRLIECEQAILSGTPGT